MNSGQGVNYEVSGCVLMTAESDAVPLHQSLVGIVFCFRIITLRADTPRRFVLGKSSSHMTIPRRQVSSRRVSQWRLFVSLCAEPRRGQLVGIPTTSTRTNGSMGPRPPPKPMNRPTLSLALSAKDLASPRNQRQLSHTRE